MCVRGNVAKIIKINKINSFNTLAGNSDMAPEMLNMSPRVKWPTLLTK